MKQNTFDIDGVNKDTPINLSLLTDDGRILYQGLCKMAGVKNLPSCNNEQEINEIADKSYYRSFSDLMRKWLTPSLVDRIKNGYDYMLLLRKLASYTKNNASINKETYKERFEDPAKFHDHHKGNEIYERLCVFMDYGGIGVSDHLMEIDDIVNKGFSIHELEDAIDDCQKNGATVYNIKYLHSILRRMKEDEIADKKRWERERRDSIVCIESLEIEETLNKKALKNRRKFSKEEDDVYNRILSLGKSDDKKKN